MISASLKILSVLQEYFNKMFRVIGNMNYLYSLKFLRLFVTIQNQVLLVVRDPENISLFWSIIVWEMKTLAI